MPSPNTEFDPDLIVDQLYDIALDPDTLDGFVDAWNAAGLDSQSARDTLDSIGNFDDAFAAHLRRAQTFLHRGQEETPVLSSLLAPFDSLAAIIVDRDGGVVAFNDGATRALGLGDGDTVAALQASQDTIETLKDTLRDLFSSDKRPDRLIKLEVGERPTQTLFQIHRLQQSGPSGQPLALIVTTQYHWQPALGTTLQDVFQLTSAEQTVVRALVEGMDAKAIAAERGTSEATVRSQIKSILAKMNARSQSEVIRLVLSFRDVAQGLSADVKLPSTLPPLKSVDWLDAEVWKPFEMLTRPNGRKMYYLDLGPATGAPVLYSHTGYCAARWSRSMLKFAFRHNLRIICPVRAGYGPSENLDRTADVLVATREDTLALLAQLGIARLPYLTQTTDLLFACDLATHHPDMVSEIIGICTRPYVPSDLHYASMSKWYRFFLSTARHAPHLLSFTTNAILALGRRKGMVDVFRQLMADSPADLAMIEDPEFSAVVAAVGDLLASETSHMGQAYTMELLVSEQDWSGLLQSAKETPMWFVNGLQDPSVDAAFLAAVREHYPWIEIEVLPDAGQFALYQHHADLIPRIAASAKAAADRT